MHKYNSTAFAKKNHILYANNIIISRSPDRRQLILTKNQKIF